MTRRTGASARAQALAKATDAVARRDAQRIAREKQLQATLADFFHAQGEVEHIHAAAQTAAAPFEDSIRQAVRTLDALGETRAGIAALTGLPMAHLRQCLAQTDASVSVAANGGTPGDRALAQPPSTGS